MSGRASLLADDGERRNFHRSARAAPATCRHAGRITRNYDTAGHSLTYDFAVSLHATPS